MANNPNMKYENMLDLQKKIVHIYEDMIYEVYYIALQEGYYTVSAPYKASNQLISLMR